MANDDDDFWRRHYAGIDRAIQEQREQESAAHRKELDERAARLRTEKAQQQQHYPVQSGDGFFNSCLELGKKVPLLGQLERLGTWLLERGWRWRLPGAVLTFLVSHAAFSNPAAVTAMGFSWRTGALVLEHATWCALFAAVTLGWNLVIFLGGVLRFAVFSLGLLIIAGALFLVYYALAAAGAT